MAAVEVFVNEDEKAENRRYTRLMQSVVDQIIEIPGVDAEVVHDYNHYIPHAVIKLNDSWRGPPKSVIGERMLEAPNRIMILTFLEELPEFWVDPLNLSDEDVQTVADKLRNVLLEASNEG
jgi:hypothetical protein